MLGGREPGFSLFSSLCQLAECFGLTVCFQNKNLELSGPTGLPHLELPERSLGGRVGGFPGGSERSFEAQKKGEKESFS